MKPNIILVVIDCLRWDHVGPRAGKPSLTPNIDRLADQGLIFEQAIAQGPSTPVAMSALMSSTYASLYGGSRRLSPTRPVIQQMLKQAGYTTLAVSANVNLSRFFGWERGFDRFDDCLPETVYKKRLGMRLANQVTKRMGLPLVWPRALPAQTVFAEAQAFLNTAHSPFFMWVHLMDTHWPYTIQKFSWDAGWRRQRQIDENIRPRMISDPPRLTPQEAQELYTQYCSAIQHTDQQLGTFIEKLSNQGKLKNTWLILTADHGEEFFEHGRFFHHPTPYEILAHVPLIIIPPENDRLPAARRITDQVRSIDLVPTFLDLAGITPFPVEITGESLLPALIETQNFAFLPRPAITESPHNRVLALRQDGWVFIWDIEKQQEMLFNARQDPEEKQNLAAELPQKASEMKSYLNDHLKMVRRTEQPSSGGDAEEQMNQDLTQRLRDLGYVE